MFLLPSKRIALRRASPCGTVGRLTRGLNRAFVQRAGDQTDTGAGRPSIKRASIHRAGEVPACDGPAAGPVFWFESDFGITKDGSNLVSDWLDKTTNHENVRNTGLDANKPTWIPNDTPNGQPSLDWGASTNLAASYKYLESYTQPGGNNWPLLDGGPRTIVAVIRPTANLDATYIGGTVVGIKQTALAWGAQMLTIAGRQQTAFDGGFWWNVIPVVNYSGKWIVVSWTWAGTGATSVGNTVNGAALAGVFGNAGNALRGDNGNNGFDIGFFGPESYTGSVFSGKIAAAICYAGVLDAASIAQTVAYFTVKYGVSP